MLCSSAQADAAAIAAALGEAESEPEPELQYDDSSVRRYICEVLGGSSGSGGGVAGCGGVEALTSARVSGFRQLPGCLHDPALARAYSVDWRPGLVVVSFLTCAAWQSARPPSSSSSHSSSCSGVGRPLVVPVLKC